MREDMGEVSQAAVVQAIQGGMEYVFPEISVSMCTTHTIPVSLTLNFQEVVGVGAKGSR